MNKIKNNIKLVSIHIPKTAGTAFRKVFMENIGERNYAKLDIYSSGNIRVNNELFTGSKLSHQITAVHGHCSYTYLTKYFELSPSVEYITWLRNPVERVLSNYYFLNKIISERLNEAEDENLLCRMGKSLEEFVSAEDNQNVMSKFLEGAPLDEFRFIGIQDDYANELKRLETVMHWKHVDNQFHNVTGRKMSVINDEVIKLIRDVNSRDVALFEAILSKQ